jgi:hypothetical protein
LPPSGSTLMALGFSRLVCIEVLFVSIPSARYTDKAEWTSAGWMNIPLPPARREKT